MVDAETAARYSSAEQKTAREELEKGNALDSNLVRYNGSSTDRGSDFAAAFVEMYHHEHGFTIPDRPIIIDDVRVRARGVSESTEAELLAAANGAAVASGGDKDSATTAAQTLKPLMTVNAYYAETNGYTPTAVYRRESLQTGGEPAVGPAIVGQ